MDDPTFLWISAMIFAVPFALITVCVCWCVAWCCIEARQERNRRLEMTRVHGELIRSFSKQPLIRRLSKAERASVRSIPVVIFDNTNDNNDNDKDGDDSDCSISISPGDFGASQKRTKDSYYKNADKTVAVVVEDIPPKTTTTTTSPNTSPITSTTENEKKQ